MTAEQQPAPDAGPGVSGRPPGVPRWVKVSGIVVAILLLILIVAMFAGGDHGPGRHQVGTSIGGESQPVALGLRHARLGGW